jgi:uncharacterized cupin superfamily protein
MEVGVTSFNIDRAELEEDDEDHPEDFAAREADIGSAIGGEHLGGSLLEIPPGKRAWPYHWEAAQEEWLVVLSGTPTLRTPEGEEELTPGDVVCFPTGPGGAHALSNASGEPCRVVMLSNRVKVNVIVYPDAGKVGVRTPWLRPNFLEDDAVGYWEGE